MPEITSTFPPIPESLLRPCYHDLMPEIPNSTDVADLIVTEANNHYKYNDCYKRQYDLIQEVLLRENDYK